MKMYNINLQTFTKCLPFDKLRVTLCIMPTCTSCSSSFEIRPQDRAFYEMIGVPEPVLCPDCRQLKRLAWRNERHMYRRKCDYSGADIISMYPPDCPFKVYEQSIWWSDKWNALEYGREFDFKRPFFEQFRELQLRVPRLALVNKQSENSKFTNHAGQNKNCYLSGCIFTSEDVYYSDWIMDCKDSMDSSYLPAGCELCYEVYYAWGSYRAFFSDFIKRCRNVWFCFDCQNCSDLFMCCNLRNKQYCIENKQVTKEEFTAFMSRLLPVSFSKLSQLRSEYQKMRKETAINQTTVQVQTENSAGDLLFNSKNVWRCFDCIDTQDCSYCYDAIDVKDSLDLYHVGWAELMYECHAISNGYNCKFCHFTYDNKNATYCDCTQNCQDVFGCCGLYQKKYCILNKQYSREEYERLVPEIIKHMKKTGEWGQFFPLNFSPFAYNQSRVQEFYPLNSEKAAEKGIRWSNYKPELPPTIKKLSAADLPDVITAVSDDILETAIICQVSGQPFKIIRYELDFYRENGLPLPRLCPDERFNLRMKQRNPRKLWYQKCGLCGKQELTSYIPGSPVKVYCCDCYLKKVY